MQYRMHGFFPLEASILMEELSPHILRPATFTEKTRLWEQKFQTSDGGDTATFSGILNLIGEFGNFHPDGGDMARFSRVSHFLRRDDLHHRPRLKSREGRCVPGKHH